MMRKNRKQVEATTMRKSREQLEAEAIAYNPEIKDLLKADPDYCIRGMVHDPRADEYMEFRDFMLEVKSLNRVNQLKEKHRGDKRRKYE